MRPRHFPVTLLIYAVILNLRNSVEAKPKPKSKWTTQCTKATQKWTSNERNLRFAHDLIFVRMNFPLCRQSRGRPGGVGLAEWATQPARVLPLPLQQGGAWHQRAQLSQDQPQRERQGGGDRPPALQGQEPRQKHGEIINLGLDSSF